ncbi:MAG: beta-ketoacyl synthase N-terminal-like domain-containing protein [Pirellulaceae bacterium]
MRAASSCMIGEATETIRRGDVDVMLGWYPQHDSPVRRDRLQPADGAVDRTHDEPIGIALVRSTAVRDGFVLGEGSSMLVLEELEHAKRRGAPILGEILGIRIDRRRVPHHRHSSRGSSAIGCMRMALADANLSPDAIDYVNAHGTSTLVNDRVEARACHEVSGDTRQVGTDLQHQEHDGPLDRGGQRRS